MEEELYEEIVEEPRAKPWVWVVYLLLFALAIPWYWPAGSIGRVVMGVPLWVAVTLGSVVLLALWTVFVIARYWRVRSEGEDR